MDFTGKINCVNCKTEMKMGNMVVGIDIMQSRHCDECGVRIILFKPHKDYEYGLHRELKEKS